MLGICPKLKIDLPPVGILVRRLRLEAEAKLSLNEKVNANCQAVVQHPFDITMAGSVDCLPSHCHLEHIITATHSNQTCPMSRSTEAQP